MRKLILTTYIILLGLLSGLQAQTTYPIYVTPTLTPPYSLNLSDYSKFGSQQLIVSILVNDLEISNLPVKLRIKMETMGVTIETPITINTTPLYLDGGTVSTLFGKDLEDYFNINNLIFKGYSKETYKRTGQLPEGFYRFTVEVLHYNTNRLISNIGSTSAWIALGKPPMLKKPLTDAQMGQFNGMPLTFSWLPCNVASPVSANNIQYNFEMWEMRVPGVDANTVVYSMPVFHEYTSFSPIYSLYPSTLLMEPGMQYCWRVTASDAMGFVPFEQGGMSEVRTFMYKASCDPVSDLSAENRGQVGIFDWTPNENHTGFNVEVQNPVSGWYSESQTFDNKVQFHDLEYGSTYDLRVQAVCDGNDATTSDFSEWVTLELPDPQPLVNTDSCPECGCDDVTAVELTNFDLRTDLQPGDTIINKTATTRFLIKSVEPQSGDTYKGVFFFWAEIWGLKIPCNYWDLQVNTDNVVVNMEFESVYDPQFLIDVDAIEDYLDDLIDDVTDLLTDTSYNDTITITDDIFTTYVNDGDSLIIVTANGEITVDDDVTDSGGTLITDGNGGEVVITGNGDVMGAEEFKKTGGNNRKIEKYLEEQEANNLGAGTVDFTAAANQLYGFDAYNSEKSALQNEYPALQNGYVPTYKSVASYSTDIVSANTTDQGIVYKSGMGIPAPKGDGSITIRGASHGSQTVVYARTNDTLRKIVGKLNIQSYDEQAKKVFIVPVNNATVPGQSELRTVLNTIFQQAVTKWEVVIASKVSNVLFADGKFTHGGSSPITTYGADQKTVVQAFEEQHGELEKDALYLFYIEHAELKESSIAGYMPLKRQVGFIYGSPELNIVAHELSHGTFNLYHTFSSHNALAGEGTTNNLMDYNQGTELWKHQWDLIHDPENLLFGGLQDEEEGEFGITDTYIKSLTFSGEGFPSHLVKKESYVDLFEGGPTHIYIPEEYYEGAQWQKVEEGESFEITMQPVSLVSNKEFKLSPVFANRGASNTSEITIKASCDFNSDPLIVRGVINDNNEIVVHQEDVSLLKFKTPNQIDYYEEFKVDWGISYDNGETYAYAGKTNNKLYVILEMPELGTMLAEKYLYFGCTKAKGKSSKAECFNSLWQPFSNKKVLVSDFGLSGNSQLKYYASSTPDNLGFFTNYDGECGKWRDLLLKILRVQGYTENEVYEIQITPINSSEVMIVKNWQFEIANGTKYYDTDNSQEYTHMNISPTTEMKRNLTGGTYEWIHKETNDQMGIAGQGVSNPYCDFTNHQLLYLNIVGVNNQYCDPSYGALHISEEDVFSNFWGFATETSIYDYVEQPVYDNEGNISEFKKVYGYKIYFRIIGESDLFIDN